MIHQFTSKTILLLFIIGCCVSLKAQEYNTTVVEDNMAYAKALGSPTPSVYLEYYPDPYDPNSPYVRVWWSGMGSYKIYRSDCYDTNPTMIAQNITSGEYIDTNWGSLEPGTYKYGIRVNTEAISWSNCLDMGMYSEMVSITVLMGDGNSPEGTTVSFVNHNSADQALYPIAPITLDETGYYMWDVFRNGNYQITITKSAYETIVDEVAIWENSYSMSYILIPSNAYTINVSANPVIGGTVTGGGYYQYGASCTVTATANTGYTFLRWTENGTQVSTNANYTFTVTGNRTLVAQFLTQTYTISATADPTIGGTVSGSGTYNYGQSCTLTATPAAGHEFINWTKNGQQVSTNSTYTFTVTESATYVAHFQLQSFVVTTTANPDEGGVVTGGGTVHYGNAAYIQASPNLGYNFVNWTENGEVYTTNTEFSVIVFSNRDFVANFEVQTIEISANVDPVEGGVAMGSGTYNYGDEVTIDVETNENWVFQNWTEDGEIVSEEKTFTLVATSDRNLVAHLIFCGPNSHTITVRTNPEEVGMVYIGDIPGTLQQNFSLGETCTVHAISNEDYDFINWTNYETGEQYSALQDYSFIVEGDLTLVANFTSEGQIIYVDIDPEEGGTATGSGVYNQGDTCSLEAYPNPGYEFVNWTLGDLEVSVSTNYTFTVTETARYIAHFEKTVYTITATAEPEEAGMVTGGGKYYYGSTCTLTASPNIGYTFTKWMKGNTILSTDCIYSFQITEDASFMAYFSVASDTYCISASSSSCGSISPVGDVYVEAGESITFTLIPDEGCRISMLMIDGERYTPIESITFYNVNCNHTIQAGFDLLDIEENETKPVIVSPNPVKGKALVECQDMRRITLYNLSGIEVFDLETHCDTELISLDKLSPGMYLMKVIVEGNRYYYSKLIISE